MRLSLSDPTVRGIIYQVVMIGLVVAVVWWLVRNTMHNVGVLNTLKVAVIGIVLATILGTLIGIARLSKNWLLAKIAAFYVEVIRDLPLLLQLLFWYTILQGLPGPRQALNPVRACSSPTAA
jgi:general L-amino acid transport system permease protein